MAQESAPQLEQPEQPFSVAEFLAKHDMGHLAGQTLDGSPESGFTYAAAFERCPQFAQIIDGMVDSLPDSLTPEQVKETVEKTIRSAKMPIEHKPLAEIAAAETETEAAAEKTDTEEETVEDEPKGKSEPDSELPEPQVSTDTEPVEELVDSLYVEATPELALNEALLATDELRPIEDEVVITLAIEQTQQELPLQAEFSEETEDATRAEQPEAVIVADATADTEPQVAAELLSVAVEAPAQTTELSETFDLIEFADPIQLDELSFSIEEPAETLTAEFADETTEEPTWTVGKELLLDLQADQPAQELLSFEPGPEAATDASEMPTLAVLLEEIIDPKISSEFNNPVLLELLETQIQIAEPTKAKRAIEIIQQLNQAETQPAIEELCLELLDALGLHADSDQAKEFIQLMQASLQQTNATSSEAQISRETIERLWLNPAKLQIKHLMDKFAQDISRLRLVGKTALTFLVGEFNESWEPKPAAL